MEGVKSSWMNFINKFIKIQNCITPNLIQKAFQKTGIYALDISVFSDSNFAPSICSSSTAHVRASYPDEVPTSPISAISSELPSSDSEYILMPILSNTSTDTNLPPSNPPNDSEYQSNSQWLEFAQVTHSNMNFSPQSQSSLIPPNCYYHTQSTTAHINHYIAGAYQTLVQSQLQDPELLLNENQQLCMLITTLNSKVAALQAELDASNAHYMLVCRELNDVHQQLASQSKVRTQSTLKCKA